MRRSFTILLFPVLVVIAFASVNAEAAASSHQLVRKTVISWKDTTSMQFLYDPTFFSEGWDTLGQVRFWKEVINLTGDTCIINIASCRKPIQKISRTTWHRQTEMEKSCFKDSLCSVNCLNTGTELFVTAGKGEFYEVKKTLPLISTAIQVFEQNGCDPWFAQTILLIESPGKLKTKSSVGASGPFQLMPAVARRFGLTVNKYRDDRSDIEKSAKAAARLITTTCVPYIRSFLDAKNVSYEETDLWFRLLVLHAYHAGAGNVRCVINVINPSSGGIGLMQQVWQTTCGGFKNESQNYSQIALASIANFDELIGMDDDTVYLVRGDKLLHEYYRFSKSMKPYEAFEYMQQTLVTYEKDFIDEMIPYEDFIIRIAKIRAEFVKIAERVKFIDNDVVLKQYPAGEDHIIALSNELTKRRRYEDAVRLLRLNLSLHPGSRVTADTLARNYRLMGDPAAAAEVLRQVGK